MFVRKLFLFLMVVFISIMTQAEVEFLGAGDIPEFPKHREYPSLVIFDGKSNVSPVSVRLFGFRKDRQGYDQPQPVYAAISVHNSPQDLVFKLGDESVLDDAEYQLLEANRCIKMRRPIQDTYDLVASEVAADSNGELQFNIYFLEKLSSRAYNTICFAKTVTIEETLPPGGPPRQKLEFPLVKEVVADAQPFFSAKAKIENNQVILQK